MVTMKIAACLDVLLIGFTVRYHVVSRLSNHKNVRICATCCLPCTYPEGGKTAVFILLPVFSLYGDVISSCTLK